MNRTRMSGGMSTAVWISFSKTVIKTVLAKLCSRVKSVKCKDMEKNFQGESAQKTLAKKEIILRPHDRQ